MAVSGRDPNLLASAHDYQRYGIIPQSRPRFSGPGSPSQYFSGGVAAPSGYGLDSYESQLAGSQAVSAGVGGAPMQLGGVRMNSPQQLMLNKIIAQGQNPTPNQTQAPAPAPPQAPPPAVAPNAIGGPTTDVMPTPSTPNNKAAWIGNSGWVGNPSYTNVVRARY